MKANVEYDVQRGTWHVKNMNKDSKSNIKSYNYNYDDDDDDDDDYDRSRRRRTRRVTSRQKRSTKRSRPSKGSLEEAYSDMINDDDDEDHEFHDFSDGGMGYDDDDEDDKTQVIDPKQMAILKQCIQHNLLIHLNKNQVLRS